MRLGVMQTAGSAPKRDPPAGPRLVPPTRGFPYSATRVDGGDDSAHVQCTVL